MSCDMNTPYAYYFSVSCLTILLDPLSISVLFSMSLSTNCLGVSPWAISSAPLSSVGQYRHSCDSVVSMISLILFAMNHLSHFVNFSQFNIMLISDQKNTCLQLSVALMCVDSLDPITAAISSNCGMVSCFTGATLVLAITKVLISPLHRYALALWAMGLAWQNTCKTMLFVV